MSFKRFAEAERAIRDRKPVGAIAWVGERKLKQAVRVDIDAHFTLTQNGERKMLFYRKYIVRKHERGLLSRDGDFQSFLAPGVYRYFNVFQQVVVETYNLANPVFRHELLDYLIDARHDVVDVLFEVVETASDQLALVFSNEELIAVQQPSSRALYWKQLVAIRVQRFRLQHTSPLDAALARRLCSEKATPVASQIREALYSVVVPAGSVGLLYLDGKFVVSLEAGLHAFWQLDRQVNVVLVDLRLRTLEVQGQEILTRDKVALRINVTVSYQFTDAAKAMQLVKDPLDHLYKEIQFGLRAAVGTRTLDSLLEDKTRIDGNVNEYLKASFGAIGIEVKRVGVKDIILPGDMKALLARVVEAEKAAQANVIRRREETNATRSLLNTAKVMESNGVALRLKELETLERVTENVGNLSVYGGLDAVMDGLVRLAPKSAG